LEAHHCTAAKSLCRSLNSHSNKFSPPVLSVLICANMENDCSAALAIPLAVF